MSVGDSRIELAVNGVTDVQIDRLVDDIADVVASHGLGCGDDASSVRSLIVIRGKRFPRSKFAFKRLMRGAGGFVIPRTPNFNTNKED